MDDPFAVADIVEEERSSRRAFQKLPPSFYQNAQRLIATLEQQLASSEPESRGARMLSDQLSTARRNLAQLFKNRMDKIMRFAVMSATSEWEDESGKMAKMDELEKEVYTTVRDVLLRARESAVDTAVPAFPASEEKATAVERAEPAQGTGVPAPPAHEERTTVQPSEPAVVSQPSDGAEPSEEISPPPSKNNINEEYVVVRTLEAVPTFLGSDGRTYALGREDVATVPAANAKVLIKRGIAVGVSTEGFSAKAQKGEQ